MRKDKDHVYCGAKIKDNKMHVGLTSGINYK